MSTEHTVARRHEARMKVEWSLKISKSIAGSFLLLAPCVQAWDLDIQHIFLPHAQANSSGDSISINGRSVAAIIEDVSPDEIPEGSITSPGSILDQMPSEYQKPIYVHVTVGMTSTSYSGDVKSTIDIYKNNSNFDQSLPLGFSFGFYLPTSKSFAVGSALDFSRDHYIAPDKQPDGEPLNFNVYHQSVAVSAISSPNGVLGKGIMLRGDLGVSRMTFSQTGADSTHSSVGFHSKLGMGAGFGLAQDASLLLMGSYTYRRIQNEDLNQFGLDLGILF